MLLALDTSTRLIGVALYDGVAVLSEAFWTSRNHHSVELAPAVAEALERAEVRAHDLEAIGVALGPGSFTSLRVGLAFAKGMAMSGHLALVGIPTLDVVARAQALQDTPLVAVLEAGRGRLAAGWYRVEDGAWNPTGPVEIVTPQELARQITKPTAFCGELSAEVRRVLGRKYKSARLASPARSARRPGYLAE